MAEEKINHDNLNLAVADDMIVLNALMHSVKGMSAISVAPAFEATSDSF